MVNQSDQQAIPSKTEIQNCTSGMSRTLSGGMGSNSFKISGPNGDNCEITYSIEIEGGYTNYLCLVPRNLDFSLEKYCKVSKTGNLLMEQNQIGNYILVGDLSVPLNSLTIAVGIGILVIIATAFVLFLKKIHKK